MLNNVAAVVAIVQDGRILKSNRNCAKSAVNNDKICDIATTWRKQQIPMFYRTGT